MQTVTLMDLGPIIAAILGPMLAFIVVSMRYQHQDSVKTRELIVKTRELITNSEKETREWVIVQLAGFSDRLSGELRELGRGLGDARERLARIEGHLGIGRVPPQDEAGERDPDAA